MYGQVACGVHYFNTVGTSCAATTGRVRVAAEVVGCVVIAQTGQTQVDWVHARHEFQSAEDVTNTDFKTTGTCEETNAVDACTGRGASVVCVVLLDASTCTECDACVRFCCCVDLQAET
ncbi:hypothetical protein Z947_995 [Sulfitobacter geojensis]|nr:hypothetical protein Z947_995 [Sulfitobacter geojensis]